MKCDVCTRKELHSNVLLYRGTVVFRLIFGRMMKELTAEWQVRDVPCVSSHFRAAAFF